MLAAKIVIGRRQKEAQAEEASSGSESGSYTTLRPNKGSAWSFSTTLTGIFALVSLLTAVVLVLVLAIVWEGQFQDYTRENMERLAEGTAATLATRYEDAGNKWTSDVLSYAQTASAASDELMVQVFDGEDRLLYSDAWGNDDFDGAAVAAAGRSDSVVRADVTTSDGEVVGTVVMMAFGPDALLTKSDAAFRTRSYWAIGIAAVAAVILAFIIGHVASKAMTKPLKRITSTAAQIRNGDLSARTGLTGDNEIGQLGETFDDMANKLEKDLKHERRITGDVAHELRTPLMAMLATVEGMHDGVVATDDEHFQILESEIGRLSRLIDAMLHLSRLESGTTPFKPRRQDVVWLARNIVTAQRKLFHDRDLHLKFVDETPHGELMADVDADMLTEAIINLLSNARRYTPEGGYVVVKVKQDKTDALISVADTGIGIAQEDLSRVFSRFWRSDASRERASGGLGVGLAITKDVIDKHSGTIEVESKLKHGTTFTLRIPIDQEVAEGDEELIG